VVVVVLVVAVKAAEQHEVGKQTSISSGPYGDQGHCSRATTIDLFTQLKGLHGL
jgi:hypothetical protein